jgi:hypothetical protein
MVKGNRNFHRDNPSRSLKKVLILPRFCGFSFNLAGIQFVRPVLYNFPVAIPKRGYTSLTYSTSPLGRASLVEIPWPTKNHKGWVGSLPAPREFAGRAIGLHQHRGT